MSVRCSRARANGAEKLMDVVAAYPSRAGEGAKTGAIAVAGCLDRHEVGDPPVVAEPVVPVGGDRRHRQGRPPRLPRLPGMVRVVRRLVPLAVLAVPVAGCGTPSSAPSPRSTVTIPPRSSSTVVPPAATPPTSAPQPYAIEQCGGITTSTDVHPDIDNRNLLLSATDGPAGYTYGPAKTAGGPTVTASVPSSAPAVYEAFQVPASAGGGSGQEVIGFVDSNGTAAQLARQVQAALVSCNGGVQVPLPTSAPGVIAETYQFALSRSNGWVSSATVTVPDGPYIVSLQWSNSNTCSTYGGAPCPPPPAAPPPVPSASQMAQLVDAALAKIDQHLAAT